MSIGSSHTPPQPLGLPTPRMARESLSAAPIVDPQGLAPAKGKVIQVEPENGYAKAGLAFGTLSLLAFIGSVASLVLPRTTFGKGALLKLGKNLLESKVNALQKISEKSTLEEVAKTAKDSLASLLTLKSDEQVINYAEQKLEPLILAADIGSLVFMLPAWLFASKGQKVAKENYEQQHNIHLTSTMKPNEYVVTD